MSEKNREEKMEFLEVKRGDFYLRCSLTRDGLEYTEKVLSVIGKLLKDKLEGKEVDRSMMFPFRLIGLP